MQVNSVVLASAVAVLLVYAQAPSGQAAENQRKASEFAFDLADRDGNGVINEAELAYDTAAGFAGLDQDGDGVLSKQEVLKYDAPRYPRAGS